MPNLWNDVTTAEAEQIAGMSAKSKGGSMRKRIRQDKQPAIARKRAITPGYKYWINEEELAEALATWPLHAKKPREPKPEQTPPHPNAARKHHTPKRKTKELRGLTPAPHPDACPALPLFPLDKPQGRRKNSTRDNRGGNTKCTPA